MVACLADGVPAYPARNFADFPAETGHTRVQERAFDISVRQNLPDGNGETKLTYPLEHTFMQSLGLALHWPLLGSNIRS